MAIQREIGDRDGEATSLSNIGNLFREMGNYEESVEYNARSVEIMRDIGDPRGISQSLKNLAISYVEAGNYDEAMSSVDEDLKISADIGVKSIEGASLWVKASILRRKGELEESERYFEDSMAILDSGEDIDRTALAKGLYEYALLFKELGRKEDADKSLRRALSMFESMGMNLWAENCRRTLKEVNA